MTDGFRAGWDHATFLAGYLSGAVWPLLLVAALFALGWRSSDLLSHYRKVCKLRRDSQRTGRYPLPTTDELDTSGPAFR
ncbi:hypothetical protein [Blastococcus mobilis]|uniref:Uncharacterized protein n=1 Tax=Blastococcus mobilis TaxID=1938746 RepID=A0A238VFA3_9ACTN|nr:hypothetical protein [Blastococcus mobilis]SNR32936.1 hypothetical protein SAMN06272737_10370 [Blastococcus mobilis]